MFAANQQPPTMTVLSVARGNYVGKAEIADIAAQGSLGPEGGGNDVSNATVFNR